MQDFNLFICKLIGIFVFWSIHIIAGVYGPIINDATLR